MTIFSFPAVQAGDAMTVEIINGVRTSFQDFADGATGAPRIRGDALADEDDFLVAVNASNDHEITHGLDIVEGQTGNSSSSTYVVGYTITVISFTGSIRFKLTINAGSGIDHDLRIKRTTGGSTTILQTWSGSNEDTRTIDVPVAVGDVIEWEHKHDGGLASSSVYNPIQSGDVFLEDRAVYREAT